eukprot:g2670.t1
MYSTKTFCDKQYKFKKLSTLCVGDPYVKEKEAVNSRWRGKQFQTQPGEKGRLKPTYPFKSDPYDDTRSKGTKGGVDLAFGSRDVAARGEFSDTLNVRRYREKMHYENKHTYAEANAKNLETSKKEEIKEAEDKTLFDRVFSESYIGRFDREPLECMKSKRGRRELLNTGKWRTSSRDVGSRANKKIPQSVAEHGIKGVVKDFYDNVGTGR